MKWPTVTLFLLGLAALAWAAVGGGPQAHWMWHGIALSALMVPLRLAGLVAGIFLLVAARACALKKPYGWRLVSILLFGTMVVCLAVGLWGYYILTTNTGSNHRGVALVTLAPAAILAWIAFKIWPKSQAEFGLAPPERPKSAEEQKADEEEFARKRLPVKDADDPFDQIGAWTPHEAVEVIELLKKAGLRFLIETDTRSPDKSVLSLKSRLNTVRVYLHQDDREKGVALLTAEGKSFGAL